MGKKAKKEVYIIYYNIKINYNLNIYTLISKKEKYKKEKRSLLPDETDQPIFSTLSGKVFDSNVKYQNYARVMTLALVNSAVFCNCHCNQDKEENGFIHANKIC